MMGDLATQPPTEHGSLSDDDGGARTLFLSSRKVVKQGAVLRRTDEVSAARAGES